MGNLPCTYVVACDAGPVNDAAGEEAGADQLRESEEHTHTLFVQRSRVLPTHTHAHAHTHLARRCRVLEEVLCSPPPCLCLPGEDLPCFSLEALLGELPLRLTTGGEGGGEGLEEGGSVIVVLRGFALLRVLGLLRAELPPLDWDMGAVVGLMGSSLTVPASGPCEEPASARVGGGEATCVLSARGALLGDDPLTLVPVPVASTSMASIAPSPRPRGGEDECDASRLALARLPR